MPGLDLIVIGAGAAGIAAARAGVAAGASVLILEARDRVGGRAVTKTLRGHAVDLGAHWLHAGPINPLVQTGLSRGEPMRRAPQASHLMIGRQAARPAERRAFGVAFDRADRAMSAAAAAAEDRSAASALGFLGPFGPTVAAIHGLVCGRPLTEVSLHDFPSLEYADNWFIAGGYGAYVARLAEGLPIRFGCRVDSVVRHRAGVDVRAGSDLWRARAAIVTAPPTVLAAGSIRFAPDLPAETARAIDAFRPGVYEHVVLWWPSSPFGGADRLVSFSGGRPHAPGMLSRIDGTPLHYLELDAPMASRARSAAARAALARGLVRHRIGAGALRGLAVLAATDWLGDPLSRGSWAVLPPGAANARSALSEPVDGRLGFAGEWGDARQWGTVGAAWVSGERTATRLLAGL